MLNKLSIFIIERLISADSISKSDKELYTYGGFVFLSNLFYIIIAISFGLIFHCIIQILVFIIVLFFLRSYAGGYHANTELRCEILTTIMLFSTAIIIKLVKQNTSVWLLFLTFISVLIILILAPLTSSSKPLDDKLIKKNKKVTFFIVISISIIILICFIWHINIVLIPCCLSFIIESLSLVGGTIKGVIISE